MTDHQILAHGLGNSDQGMSSPVRMTSSAAEFEELVVETLSGAHAAINYATFGILTKVYTSAQWQELANLLEQLGKLAPAVRSHGVGLEPVSGEVVRR